ncbi:amidase [Mycolicibacterium goodii]|uniref:amidase n=1 Tax=Mycolicibacterium goodii TaxID=134601 RepID=UPI001BDC52E1|nr:amidase [Mycolicibacterium goodii]MBU8818375.1 amidase [Mycolicibacterium goodii]
MQRETGYVVDDSLIFGTATDLTKALRRRDVSAREVLAAHVEQIERHNAAVNAVVSLDVEGAERAAAEADRRCAAGEPLGRLHGLPISFKDTHATAGMRTTFGSPLHSNWVPRTDDEIVRRIQGAGAIRLGKTNVPEFAAGSHSFNPIFGTTRNPYALDRSAGGSSGGAAAALASGMQPIADGSDMGGSLRNPASFCNVVGLRPTPGRVPDPGAAWAYPNLATAGPMARTVADVALLLSVIAGPHRDDPTSLSDDPAPFATVNPADLKGLRVAWAPTLGDRIPVDAEVLAPLETAVGVFAELGARVEQACPDLDGADATFRTLRAVEFDTMWGDQLDADPEAFKADLAWNIREGRARSTRDVGRALTELTRLRRAACAFFDTYDVLLAPVCQVAPFDADALWPTEVAGVPQHTYLDWMASCYLITTLGVPAISVPAGFTPDGLPVGLQIVTRARTEQMLLAVAAAFEDATGHGRRRPALTLEYHS